MKQTANMNSSEADLARPRKMLFFSRGKGRGHAVPDAAIGNELQKLEPRLELTFVSYSTGAATLKELGKEVIDLGLPEDNPLWDTSLRVVRLLRDQEPHTIVVSHEEFCVAPLAKAFGFPTVFLTDWFVSAESHYMRSLQHADEIIFMDRPGLYDEPSYLSGKVHYVGCVLRPLNSQGLSREEARLQLGLPLKR